ncbi:TRAP transporter substrate-binding protein [Roseospira marina]|uniref:TRAP transporter substrate-binding protein n=1 Tax=Roseospira marina TaxID=140057 RepID=A0A5M6I8G9_9PROT|nr:TRAP transporter substrate-binding protein [Roseospira marina]KAA5604501.1 TRAP transporter substrate-binding protein [Roseospira marina]MBB4315558.1 TRAP-type mannitol/chloroaromatic compound transport system substrate-binding protein [Roseospira marina]MBB5088505.1 TRAP-type mannitol/chloroaromatic compound transport system substrate-binding protein [Roseospira marina]
MKRREFLSGAAVAGAGAAAASTLATPAIAQDKRELKMVTTWPKNFPGLGTSAERWAQRITAMSGGRLSVKVFAAGELVPAFEAFDAVSSGTADLYHGAEYYWQGKSKAFNFFAAVPFGLTATEMNAWIYHGGGQALWDDLSAGFNIKPMLVANTGVQMGGWFNKEINSLEDYKGLKIRMPGLGGEVLRRVGATVVSLPGGEIFPALQSGAIDATEWVGPWNDLAFGFYKVAQYYYYPGFHEPGTSLSGGVNMDVWNGLSAEDKAIIEAAAAAENDFTLAEFNARNGDALDTLVNEHGVDLRMFSDEVMTGIGNAAGEVVAEVAAEDPVTQAIYDSFVAFRSKAIGWSRIADQAYGTARELPYTYKRG